MRFNKVHVAWFGNKSAIETADRASGEVFAQMVNADGTQGYHSHLIVHKDSPIKSLDDVLDNAKSYTFGNGDPNSTSGFLVPSYYVFAMNNADAKSLFKIVRNANHEANALAVANKQVDVATNNLRARRAAGEGCVHEALQAVGFQRSSNLQLVPIRQRELYREKTKLQADAAVPDAEKKMKLAQIDKRLAELNQQLARK